MFHSQIMKSAVSPAVNKIKEKGASILGSMLKRPADLSYSFQSQKCGRLSGQVVWVHVARQ